jgi:hypothetical protein
MKAILACLLLLVSCGNYGNVYLPQGERKPLSGPDPRDFPAALPASLGVADRVKLRFNVAPGPARLRAAWTSYAGASVVFRVNARKIAEAACGAGECSVARPVPDGTILKGVATLVEIETTAPIILQSLVLEP